MIRVNSFADTDKIIAQKICAAVVKIPFSYFFALIIENTFI